MLTAKQYARIQPIMCNKYTLCTDCPLAKYTRENNFNNCFIARVMNPAACVELVEQWWLEHKDEVREEYLRIKTGGHYE